jgi:hypothetical protein
MFTGFCCIIVVSLVCYFVLVYMEVVPEPITMSDRIKTFLDDP